MNNDRPLLRDNLDRCAFHPDRPTVGWRDITGEDGSTNTIGVCSECVADLGHASSDLGPVVCLSRGEPCRCGPGFCASDRGVGYVGYCAGSRPNAAPDCPVCGAPHQSDAGCWLHKPSGDRDELEIKADEATLKCLQAGISTRLVLDLWETRYRDGYDGFWWDLTDEAIAAATVVPKPR